LVQAGQRVANRIVGKGELWIGACRSRGSNRKFIDEWYDSLKEVSCSGNVTPHIGKGRTGPEDNAYSILDRFAGESIVADRYRAIIDVHEFSVGTIYQ
jgi:hypothetical protein